MVLDDIPHVKNPVSVTGLKPGQLYVARRSRPRGNPPWIGPAKIMTCKRVDEENGWVIPTDDGSYWYNAPDCYLLDPSLTQERIDHLMIMANEEHRAWSYQYTHHRPLHAYPSPLNRMGDWSVVPMRDRKPNEADWLK